MSTLVDGKVVTSQNVADAASALGRLQEMLAARPGKEPKPPALLAAAVVQFALRRLYVRGPQRLSLRTAVGFCLHRGAGQRPSFEPGGQNGGPVPGYREQSRAGELLG